MCDLGAHRLHEHREKKEKKVSRQQSYRQLPVLCNPSLLSLCGLGAVECTEQGYLSSGTYPYMLLHLVFITPGQNLPRY
jgi:hypothetical protein